MARDCYGRCAAFLVLALVLDAAGLALVLAGAAGEPTRDGRSFKDFLMLTGGLLLFVSLLCWLVWYSGNLRGVPAEELSLGTDAPSSTQQPRRPASLLRLAAKLSRHLTQRRRSAPAPYLLSGPGLPAKTPKTAASSSGSSPRPAGPLELGRLRTAAQLDSAAATEERLV